MTTSLSFSLSPPALIRLHEVLICLAKFNESVSIEAEYGLLRLSALNSTKTGYSSFALDADTFFEDFSFSIGRDAAASENVRSDRFCCQIYLKALLSVFKGRTSEKDKDTAVERCEVELHEDAQQTECRLTIRMICGLGVIKSYKLTYEPATIQHAVFDRTKTTNQWAIEPRFLKEIIAHFSPSAEQLDIHSDGDKAIFTSFTTKVTDGKEILKQPVHTSVAIDKRDFEDFLVESNLHVAINVKDFKAVISNAETANAVITARYTRPCRPVQLAYEFEGINSQFTLMTRGEADNDNTPNSSRAPAPELTARQTPLPAQAIQANGASNTAQMPPPPSRSVRPSTANSTQAAQRPAEPPKPSQSIDFDSLFIPADDDRQWDVPDDEDEGEAEDMLGWDATGEQATAGPRLRDNDASSSSRRDQQAGKEQDIGIPPTQRISQLHGLGLFD